MGVRVRLSRNASMYLPFWVAIPVWLIWVEVLAAFWLAVLGAWLLWAMVILPVAGIAALTRNPEAANNALHSLNWSRKRRSSGSLPASRARTYHGAAKLPNGATWKCQHAHRTQGGADSCAQEAVAAVMAGRPVSPAPVMPRNHCWYCGARKKDHDEAGNHPWVVVMPF